MEHVDYVELIRYALLLLTGFWIARKLRSPLRDIILRLMPIKYRMSESSFNIQTRLSTVLGICIAFLIAWGLNWCVNEITQLFVHPGDPPTILSPTPNTKETQEKTETAPPLSLTPTISTEDVAHDPVEKPKPQTMPIKEPTTTPTSYNAPILYLQVEAFQHQALAWRLQSRLLRTLDKDVWLAKGRVPDHAPFKVLIGPFNSRAEALRYRHDTHLDAFLQPAHNIRLLPQ